MFQGGRFNPELPGTGGDSGRDREEIVLVGPASELYSFCALRLKLGGALIRQILNQFADDLFRHDPVIRQFAADQADHTGLVFDNFMLSRQIGGTAARFRHNPIAHQGS